MVAGVWMSLAGAYTRSHFRSTRAHSAPSRSIEATFIPHITHIDPWMCPGGAQVGLEGERCVRKVLKLSSEVSECKPLVAGHGAARLRAAHGLGGARGARPDLVAAGAHGGGGAGGVLAGAGAQPGAVRRGGRG
jgi:hypothetical protein